MLILLTRRPETQPALGKHPHLTRLTLNRLGRGSTNAITFRTVGGAAGLRQVIFTVGDGAGGVSGEAIKTVNVT